MLVALREYWLWILILLVVAVIVFAFSRRARVRLPAPELPRKRERREVRPDMVGYGDNQRWVFWTTEFVAYSLQQLRQHYETIGWYVIDMKTILNKQEEFVGAVLILERWDDPDLEKA